jgi:F420H(2)-dependent quinone reductase
MSEPEPGGGLSPSAARLGRMLNAATRFPRVQRLATRAHSALHRRTKGRLLGRWFGSPVLILETVGRRSGKPRTTPVIYARDGDALIVSPANAGSARVPAWWLNLEAAGTAVAIVAGERRPVRARRVEGPEAKRLWGLLARQSPSIDAYPQFTDREFPVIALEPDDAAG